MRRRTRNESEFARLLTESEAATYLAVANKTLEKWRSLGCGPEFIRVGTRGVRYARDDLDEFITSRRRRSTADPGPELQPAA